MTATAAHSWIDGPAWSPRRARWFLVAAHLPFVLASPVYAVTGLDAPRASYPAIPLLAGLAIGALQLRHSLAAAEGQRPRGWRWTFLALITLVYLPMPWLSWNWADTQLFVTVSAIMLLRGRVRLVLTALPLIGMAVALVGTFPTEYENVGLPLKTAWATVWLSAGWAIGLIATYGSVWLVRVVDELSATRTELAEAAIVQERLRVSRDLHDLLGQNLSAISLKGDLALRLLSRDVPAAQAQIDDLTGVARDTLTRMRAVTRDEHAVSLAEEADGVAVLLAAAGIGARIDVDLPGLAPAAHDVLAWGVREGVTNILRHSEARACTITAVRRDGSVRLEIVNDGVRASGGEGSGLAGLAERAGALSGSVAAGSIRGRRFRLLVTIPEDAA